jgi:flagellar FliL protein
MKALVPALIALVGLGAGVGAGMALKPEPPEEEHAAAACADPATAGEADEHTAEGHGDDHAAPADGHGEPAAAAADPCAEADPFAPAPHAEAEGHGAAAFLEIEEPFVVPVFAGEKVVAMVVVELSVAAEADAAHDLEALTPRLRDSFLKVMFRHANSGGFDGTFTSGPKMDDLKSALLAAAREAAGGAPIDDVLVTEIARQDL